MKTITLLVCALLTAVVTLAADEKSAEQLADAVVKASGGENWQKVKTLDFTFNVAGQDGKQVAMVKHHWDVAAGTDTVTTNGKTMVMNLNDTNTEGDAKEAMKRWTNDSYWLLAPLKLHDEGTHLADKGEQEIEGKKYRVLEISFGSVGLTPKDKYNLYIDPETNLVRRWDYMPTPEKKVSGTWDDYQDFGGLKLATSHQFGDKRIFFTDVKVTTE